MKSSVGYLLIVFSLVNEILTIVSLATHYWLVGPASSSGLWEGCTNVAGVVACFKYDISDLYDYTRATQAFLIIAVVLLFINAGLCFVAIKKESVSKFIPILFALTGICLVISMSVFTAKVASKSYGYSYYLGWVSFVMALVGMVISAILTKIGGYSPI